MNVLGSNTFDLLIAGPVGVLAAGTLTITFVQVVPMMGFLMAATIVFFAIVRTDMLLSEREAYTLLGVYGLSSSGSSSRAWERRTLCQPKNMIRSSRVVYSAETTQINRSSTQTGEPPLNRVTLPSAPSSCLV